MFLVALFIIHKTAVYPYVYHRRNDVIEYVLIMEYQHNNNNDIIIIINNYYYMQ